MANAKLHSPEPSIHEHVESLRRMNPSSRDLAEALRTEAQEKGPHERRKLYEHSAKEFLKSGDEKEAAEAYEAAAKTLKEIAKTSSDPSSALTLALHDYVLAYILNSRSGDSENTARLDKISRGLAKTLKMSEQSFQQLRADQVLFIITTNIKDEMSEAV